jgi:hypothetical protein
MAPTALAPARQPARVVCGLMRYGRAYVRQNREGLGIPNPSSGRWIVEQVALLGTLPDEGVARLVEKPPHAVTQKQCKLGIPTFCDRRLALDAGPVARSILLQAGVPTDGGDWATLKPGAPAFQPLTAESSMRSLAATVVIWAAVVLPAAYAAPQDAPPGLSGAWTAVRMETARGVLDIDPAATPYRLSLHGEQFTFVSPFGGSRGGARVNVAAGLLDLAGDRETVVCTYWLEGGRLKLTVWPNAGVRDQRRGNPLQAGAVVLTMVREGTQPAREEKQ